MCVCLHVRVFMHVVLAYVIVRARVCMCMRVLIPACVRACARVCVYV
jgi:hypothetical protein